MHKIRFLALATLALVATSFHAARAADDVQGTRQAYYDAKLFTINFELLPPGGASSTQTHNGSINNIYDCDSCSDFVMVLDAVPGDGMNPIWQEVEITFNAGFAPHQFFRDDDVLAAAAAGEITLTTQSEVYRCAVLQSKK